MSLVYVLFNSISILMTLCHEGRRFQTPTSPTDERKDTSKSRDFGGQCFKDFDNELQEP